MRCGPFLVMLALLLGAGPALAQDSPGIMPAPKQSDAKPAKKHVKRKAAAAKAEPTESKPAETKSAKGKTVRPKRVVAKPAVAKTDAAKPAAAKPAAVEAKPPRPKPPKPKPSRRPTCSPASRAASARKSRRRCCGRATIRGVVRRRRSDAHRDQEFPEAQQGQDHRRAHAGRARDPGRRRQGARRRIRLERGGRSGHRHPHRPAEQAGAAGARRRARHALVLGAWRGAGRNLPHQGRRPQARRAVRAAEEGAGHAQGRDQRAA